MAVLKILWIDVDVAGLREAWMSDFAQHAELSPIDAGELAHLPHGDQYDLVCFNFDFPEMSTLRLIPETKKRWPSVPILMLTMQSSSDLALWALRTRVFDMLVKPITAPEIERCLSRVRETVAARRSQTGRVPRAFSSPVPMQARFYPQASAPVRMQRAIAHVAKQYRRQITASEVALLCEMSPSRFCREFKAAFGMTFLDYLSQHRLVEAKRLLANPAMSVTDVAAAVGFTDPSYFARVFKKQHGFCPSEFREPDTSQTSRSARLEIHTA